jgi:hypothetical protein
LVYAFFAELLLWHFGHEEIESLRESEIMFGRQGKNNNNYPLFIMTRSILELSHFQVE